uniref:Uncharacterized protein n=1 Tax=Rhodocyclus tenuis TaxID=1066 RepID=A0A840G6Y2_RHOTE|nr:hypothetical protein [Rhodocyclus tenuis]
MLVTRGKTAINLCEMTFLAESSTLSQQKFSVEIRMADAPALKLRRVFRTPDPTGEGRVFLAMILLPPSLVVIPITPIV